ncbi:MAG: hypothetical protein QOI71_964, partial [Gaiellales bacterium]|nr:hypothetical protein [Gaiellales bacterium]
PRYPGADVEQLIWVSHGTVDTPATLS